MTGAAPRHPAPSELRDATAVYWLGQRLDWIWVLGVKSTSSRVFPMKFSDHHTCWTRVEL